MSLEESTPISQVDEVNCNETCSNHCHKIVTKLTTRYIYIYIYHYNIQFYVGFIIFNFLIKKFDGNTSLCVQVYIRLVSVVSYLK